MALGMRPSRAQAGALPSKWLLHKDRVFRLVSCDRELGMVPDKSLVYITSDVRRVRDPSPLGMVPASEQYVVSKCSKADRVVRVRGIGPVRSTLRVMLSFLSPDRADNVLGRVPTRLLFAPNSKLVTVLLTSHPTKGQCRMQGSPTSHPVLFSQFRPRVAVYRSRRADRCPGDVAPGQENPTSVGVQGTGHDDDPGTEL